VTRDDNEATDVANVERFSGFAKDYNAYRASPPSSCGKS
jgi:hypothetical protein